jgi:hypothetical protein
VNETRWALTNGSKHESLLILCLIRVYPHSSVVSNICKFKHLQGGLLEHILKRAGFKSFVVPLCLVACASVGLKPSASVRTYENSVARDEASAESPQSQKPQPFSISGRVVRADGTGVSGVTITFLRNLGRGSLPSSVVTGADGRWSQSGFETQTSYTANLNKVGFNFQPAAGVFNGPRSDLNFEGTTDPFVKSGKVTTSVSNIDSRSSSEVGVSGATISFARVSGPGRVPTAVTTDSSGHWTQSGFEGNTVYRASPIKQGFDFNPTSAEFRNVKPNRDLNFEGQFNFFFVSGTVSGFGGARVIGATMTFQRVSGAGAVPPPVQTDAQGKWNQRFEKGTSYQVTPKKEGFIFNPATSDGLGNARSDLNFDGHSVLVKVSGRLVSFRDNTPISNAILVFVRDAANPRQLGRPGPLQAQTKADGNWSQSGFSRGATYRVDSFPTDGHLYSFLFRVEEDARDEITVPDVRVHLFYTVSGRVANSDGTGIAHVRIFFLDGKVIDSVETNSSGNWSQQLTDGETYQVRAFKPGFHFSPAIYSFDGPRTNLIFGASR